MQARTWKRRSSLVAVISAGSISSTFSLEPLQTAPCRSRSVQQTPKGRSASVSSPVIKAAVASSNAVARCSRIQKASKVLNPSPGAVHGVQTDSRSSTRSSLSCRRERTRSSPEPASRSNVGSVPQTSDSDASDAVPIEAQGNDLGLEAGGGSAGSR
eukprot:358181-Pleurochrysis_carterae.AAC.2